jgi:hypothetical protein
MQVYVLLSLLFSEMHLATQSCLRSTQHMATLCSHGQHTCQSEMRYIAYIQTPASTYLLSSVSDVYLQALPALSHARFFTSVAISSTTSSVSGASLSTWPIIASKDRALHTPQDDCPTSVFLNCFCLDSSSFQKDTTPDPCERSSVGRDVSIKHVASKCSTFHQNSCTRREVYVGKRCKT